jgi:hypothetical protein
MPTSVGGLILGFGSLNNKMMSLKVLPLTLTILGCLSLHAFAQTAVQGTIEPDAVLAKYGKVVSISPEIFLSPLIAIEGRTKVFTTDLQFNHLLRVHFKVLPPIDQSSWYVKILDSGGRVVDDNLKATDHADRFWSNEFSVSQPIIEVHCPTQPCNVQLVIDAVAVSSVQTIPQGITPPKNELKPFKNPVPALANWSDIQRWGKAVAKLRIVGDNKEVYPCTGFLLSPELLMTNNHCIKSPDETQSARADFDYDRNGAPRTNLTFKELIITDPTLDFTLLRLTDRLINRDGLPFTTAQPSETQPLILIQHPLGTPKKLSIDDYCVVAKRSIINSGASQATDFEHGCDTLGGSSGSPIQDRATGLVIGLHHFNFLPSQKLLNQGVQFGLIVQKLKNSLKSTNPAVLQELGIPVPE